MSSDRSPPAITAPALFSPPVLVSCRAPVLCSTEVWPVVNIEAVI